MKFATEYDGTPDGNLLIVSYDLQLAVDASAIAKNLQAALDNWEHVNAALNELYEQLNSGNVKTARQLQSLHLQAPLPRAWQWLDGSAFQTHADLMSKAFNLPPIETEMPLMYQGMSHQFLGPNDDVPFVSEADAIDFEGEFGVIIDAVPMGVSADKAAEHIRLLVQINDWSLRRLAPIEMKTGFGWIQAKPACSMAPIAITPGEVGEAWKNQRLQAVLQVQRNGDFFGEVPATEMAYGFDELIAHAASTRSLCAGTIIGSGTVSHSNYKQFGSCCISERRAIETIETGEAQTSFLGSGESVQMSAFGKDRKQTLFGVMDQKVIGTK